MAKEGGACVKSPFKKDHKYFNWGLTAFLVIVTSMVFQAVILNLSACWKTVKLLLGILRPILYGFAFAYILNPLMKRIEQGVRFLTRRTKWKDTTRSRLGRILGVTGSVIALLLIVYGLIALLVPQLGDSVRTIVDNFPSYYKSIQKWVDRNLVNHPEIGEYVSRALDSVYAMLEDWATTKLLGNMQALMVTLTGSVVTVVKGVLNIVIGIIIAVYVLLAKERFQAQTKKVLAVVFKPAHADRVLELGREANEVFGGFIIGKIADSAIIGVLCYFCMLIFRLPYPALIATIIGVTNIIPFFGPFIGAIPSACIILLTNPIKGIYFIILVFVLQQVDGNIIGPRILGNATGLSSFWVVVAITVFGGLFGFVGMILGVPVFAMLYMLIAEHVNKRLRAKNLPTVTDTYQDIRTISDLEPPAENSDKNEGQG